MRRVGKSSIVRLLIQHLEGRGVPAPALLYINKESLEWDHVKNYADLYQTIKTAFKGVPKPRYVFIDEIQEIPQWERVVSSILADDLADVTITGSNAHLLASELATLIAGRHIEFPAYPLSFAEFLLFRGIQAGEREAEFRLYLKYGGLPGLHQLELWDDQVFQYLKALYSTIVLKDVIGRHAVKDPGQLDLIIRFVFDNCGNITSSKRVSDWLRNQKMNAGVDKVINYLGFLQEAFLVRKVSRWDIKGPRQLELYEKYYMGDIGLRHGFLGYRDGDLAGILENLVYLELLHRGYAVSTGKWDERKVDSIAQNNREKLYIQVALQLPSQETIDREFSVLERIPDNHPKLVLSLDEFQSINRGGIMHRNLIDFLLGTSQG
ncbi:MAG: ATP-binding protein [Spirochaetota bacterium]